MNHCVPEWNLDDGSSSSYDLLRMTNNKKLMEPDQELMELLCRNGHVVMQNHSYYKPELGMKLHSSLVNSSNLVQDGEIASLFPYFLDELLEKEDCSNLSYENLASDAIDTDKLNNEVITGHRWVKLGAQEENSALTESFSEESSVRFRSNMMSPPKLQSTSTTHNVPRIENGGSVNFPHFSRLEKADFQSVSGRIAGRESGDGIRAKSGECLPKMIAGSSNCGNNQVQNNADLSHNFSNEETGLPSGNMQTGAYDNTVTSSSGGSGCSFGKTEQHGTSNHSHKRKFRDTEESDCHTERTDYDESGSTYKPAQRSSARRSRSSEVHNLSERRRRDRINEKMKALQELIPFCNKSDKASMLDEAIDYLKSLQLQVQMMWTGGGIAPIMFTGVQNCTSPMVMGMGHPPLHSLHDLVHLSRVPTVKRYLASAPTASEMQMFPSQPFNPITANQMQNVEPPESYARYLGYHHMKPPPQTANLYTYGPHMIQQGEMAAAASGSCLPTDGQIPSKCILNGKSG